MKHRSSTKKNLVGNKSMFKFCFWKIKWNHFERKKANFAVECGQFDEKFNEFVAKIKHFLAKG